MNEKTAHFKRANIRIVDESSKITYLIDITVLNTPNIQKIIIDKIYKYTELKEKVTSIWKQYTCVVSTVISSTGVIPTHLLYSMILKGQRDSTYMTTESCHLPYMQISWKVNADR